MQDSRRILVASDMSESSALAEIRAAKLCRRFGFRGVELVNVQDTKFASMVDQVLGGDKRSHQLVAEQAKKDFAPLMERLSKEFDIDVSLKVLFGRPSVEIARYAGESGACMIVTGAKRPGIGKNFFIGNTPDRLLHVTPVPMLIVRKRPDNLYQHALIPIDFSENSKYAARVAVKMMVPRARKTLLHAYNIPDENLMHYANVSSDIIGKFRRKAKESAEAAMAELVASLGGDKDSRISQVIEYGEPQKVIEDYVNANNPDLIIMGKQGRSQLERLLLGSITRNTINATACDMLVVPMKQELPAPVEEAQ
ncbi:MAG: universal stress protein [Burkholderiaceae bacterium]|jgi:nucleotide-binding universal stress UspA family protein|nr:universal stress protein [Burkholderiaceae bacterium]